MAETINLRQFRKRRLREEEAGRADANRARFGRTKAQREAETREQGRADANLSGHRRERPGEDG